MGRLTKVELDELFHPPPALETERLMLEPMRIAHAAGLFGVYADPAVAEGSKEKPRESVDAVATYIGDLLKNHEQRTGLSWALVSKEDRCVIGSVSIHGISWGNRRADLGFTMTSRLWRRGLTAETLRAVIDFSFARLRFRKLCAQNTTNNEACHALLLKLGFEQEAFLRQHAFWDDQAHDLRQYGLMAPEGNELEVGRAVSETEFTLDEQRHCAAVKQRYFEESGAFCGAPAAGD